MPKETGDLDAIGEMFWIALVELFADRQPHVNEDEHPAEHVHAVQAGDGEIARKICAVRRQKHGRTLHIRLVDLSDLLGGRNVQKMGPVHRGVGWIGVDRIKPDFVFLDVWIAERFAIVQMTGDFEPRRQTFFGSVFVAEILLIFFERLRFNVSAKVFKLLRLFVEQLDGQKNHAA